MRINITQEDIDNGMMGDCSFCPGALALMRALGMDAEYVREAFMDGDDDSYVSVTGISARARISRLDSPKLYLVWRTPDSLVAFINTFDNPLYEGAAQPGEHELIAMTNETEAWEREHNLA